MTLNDIISLARCFELEDQIDWDYLNLKEEDVYSMFALSLKEMMEIFETQEAKEVACYAIILKLLVENFVLNMRIMNGKGQPENYI